MLGATSLAQVEWVLNGYTLVFASLLGVRKAGGQGTVRLIGTIVPMSRSDSTAPVLEYLFGSKTRARVFRMLLEYDNDPPWVRELTRGAGTGVSSVQRELRELECTFGLIRRRDRGGCHFCEIVEDHPLARPLRELLKVAAEEEACRRGRPPPLWRTHGETVLVSRWLEVPAPSRPLTEEEIDLANELDDARGYDSRFG